jgi:hypothetical protein
MNHSNHQNAVHKMQRYIIGGSVLMSAMALTFPIAMSRVSQTDKFAGQPFNSQTCEAINPAQRQVTSWLETCRHLSVAPLSKAPSKP